MLTAPSGDRRPDYHRHSRPEHRRDQQLQCEACPAEGGALPPRLGHAHPTLRAEDPDPEPDDTAPSLAKLEKLRHGLDDVV
jgi:hypothetical protein